MLKLVLIDAAHAEAEDCERNKAHEPNVAQKPPGMLDLGSQRPRPGDLMKLTRSILLFLIFTLASCATMESYVPGLATVPLPSTATLAPVSMETATANPTPTPVQAVISTWTVCAASLNVRRGPAEYGPVLGWLFADQVVEIRERTGSWGRIDAPVAGWVKLSYLCEE